MAHAARAAGADVVLLALEAADDTISATSQWAISRAI
jgi:hypothetical protein